MEQKHLENHSLKKLLVWGAMTPAWGCQLLASLRALGLFGAMLLGEMDDGSPHECY